MVKKYNYYNLFFDLIFVLVLLVLINYFYGWNFINTPYYYLNIFFNTLFDMLERFINMIKDIFTNVKLILENNKKEVNN